MADWDQQDFYRLLRIDKEATPTEIEEAYANLTSALDPDSSPKEQKRANALAFITAHTARQTLLDQTKRTSYDAKLKEVQETEAEKEKIEAKRAGKLQEQQSIEEDEKLKKAALRYEAARNALSDFYYNQLFAAARQSSFETIEPEQLMGWLSAERAESLRKEEQKGRKISFRIDLSSFGGVQDMRKKRGDEIPAIIDELTRTFHLA